MHHRSTFLLLCRLAALWLSLGIAGCPGSAAELDAGADGGGSHAPLPPTPPMPPAPPVLTPCPEGWRDLTRADVIVCEPFGDETLPRCGEDEIVSLGRAAGSACESTLPCPMGEWPIDAPANAIYVRAGAIDGDGSRERPLGTLAAGVAAARMGARPLVLGEGELVGGVQVSGIPSITGLCAERTRIVDPSLDMSAPLIVRAGELALRGLRLDGALYGLWLTNGARVTAEGLSVRGPTSAIRLDGGASLDARRVRAESPSTNDLDDATIRLGPGAELTLREADVVGGGSSVYGYRRMGDAEDAHATVTIESSLLRDTPVAIAGRLDTVLRRVAIEHVGVGVVTIAPRMTELVDVRARDVGLATLGADLESGFVTDAGGRTSLSRVSILGVETGTALLALGTISPTASIVGADVVLDASGGRVAVNALAGGSITLERAQITGSAGTAVQSDGGHLVLRDLAIAGTVLDGLFGDAVGATGGGTVEIERMSASPARYGLIVLDATVATASDVDVFGGRGLGVQCDPTAGCAALAPLLTVRRARIRQSGRFGVAVIGANATIEDVEIDEVRVGDDEMLPGMGLLAAFGGTLTSSRVRVHAVHGVSVLSVEGSTVHGTSLDIADTELRECAGCGGASFGDGVVCADSGSLVMADFRVSGSARAGLAAALGCAPPSFGAGTIEGNGVGVLTDESLDATLFRTLLVRNNGTDYDRTSLSLGASELGLSESSL